MHTYKHNLTRRNKNTNAAKNLKRIKYLIHKQTYLVTETRTYREKDAKTQKVQKCTNI